MKDPRVSRPNPEVREVLRIVETKVKELKAADSHAELRGCAMVLQAHLDELLALPASIRDLEDDPAAAHRRLILPDPPNVLGRIVDPFAHGGRLPGGIVMRRQGGGITPVLSEEESRMYDPFQLSIYSVSFLEPLYATPRETVAHFRNEDVLRRYLPVDRTAIREGCHLILCDPLGCSPGEAARLAGVRSSLGAAVRRADQLAQRFGIRFLVARLTGVVHTH